jgi:hypothetical protein
MKMFRTGWEVHPTAHPADPFGGRWRLSVKNIESDQKE